MSKHFDIVYTNPPYNNNLDIKLINNLILNNLAKEIIAIHPGTFLFNRKNCKEAKVLKNSKTLENVTLFWGNDIFDGTKIHHTHCISLWKKDHYSSNININDKAFTENKEIYNSDCYSYITNVNEITVHSKIFKKAFLLYKKFKNCDDIIKHITLVDDLEHKTDFGIKLPSMRPGFDFEERDYGTFYSCFGNSKRAIINAYADKTTTITDYCMTKHNLKAYYPLWYFKTEEERQNFIIYLKSKFVRFLLSLTKCSANVIGGNPLDIIPWLDYTKVWNDKLLIKKYNIDLELWDYIDKFIPDYYSDYDKEMISNAKITLTPKHFDIVYTNPPYSCDISLLNDLILNDLTNLIIAVHPTTYLFSKDILNNKEKMKQWLLSVNIFWGNDLFNIKVFIPVGISNWNKNNNSKTIHIVDNGYSKEEYDCEYEYIMYYGSKNKETLLLRDRVIQYMKNHNGSILDNNIKAGYNGMTQYSVKFNAVCGRVPYKELKVHDSFWTMICKDESFNRCDETFRYSPDVYKTYSNQMCLWSFNSEQERTNFINYCKTKVARFLLTFTKKNVNLISGKVTNIIPWLDFSKEWTDEKLCKEFGISKELWNYIDKFIPKFYIDL